ncbi:MAG: hypothetical protein R8K47_03935 [Mariprofundaceae bacterium]
MREILLYGISALAWLFILGYSVHIFVGGLVAQAVEWWLIGGAELAGLGVLAFLARQVVRQRRRR